MTRIGVVVPVFSAFQEAVICLSRIRTRHVWTPYIAPQWKRNRAISFVWNAYATEAFEDGCDYALIINDDAWVFPNTIDNLVDEIKNTGTLLVSGVSTNLEHDKMAALTLQKANLNFSCFMITPETFEQVGFFDEHFYPAYFEDNDMHRRMILLDLPAYGITSAPFYHKGSTTFRAEQGKLHLSRYFDINKQYYIKKWGGAPGAEIFVFPFNNPKNSVKDWRKNGAA